MSDVNRQERRSWSSELPKARLAGTHLNTRRNLRQQDDHTLECLKAGGVSAEMLHTSESPYVVVRIADQGQTQENLGRKKCKSSLFEEQTHQAKWELSQSHHAFCRENNIDSVLQIVIRPPESICKVSDFSEKHSAISKKLWQNLRYGLRRYAPGMEIDIISAEVCSASKHGEHLKLHFHLVARGSFEQCQSLRAYFEARSWNWWDSFEKPSSKARHPISLVQYVAKGAGATAREAAKGDFAFSNENLAAFFLNIRGLTMTRSVGRFRKWRGKCKVEGKSFRITGRGNITIVCRKRRVKKEKGEQAIVAQPDARIVRIVKWDFGEGKEWAYLVVAQNGIIFSELEQNHVVPDWLNSYRFILEEEYV